MRRVLVTGGCGFIGCNAALDRLGRGDHVRILDNCLRPGSELNLDFLRQRAAERQLDVVLADIRDADTVTHATRDVDTVFHLASQVAVTTSVEDPRSDFEVNALGTLNVLEAARTAERPPVVLFASTNKVYGALLGIEPGLMGSRYELPALPAGVPETTPLDFHSPYGCSKGSADQYVLDYARIYGLRTVVFRQSCIYGPHQHGNVDQGWIAHFAIQALRGEQITIYGDGRQVRDVLFVDDLLEAFELALEDADRTSGRAYNIGGGPGNSVSLLEYLDLLEEHVAGPLAVEFGDWRPGDQRVYVSDVRRAEREFGWRPSTPLSVGLPKLIDWLAAEPAYAPAKEALLK